MILVVLLIALELVISPNLVLAISPPTQISPSNGATVSSSKLTWETPLYQLYSNDPYRIQVDNNSDFSSVYRDYTTKNTYYTPVLTEGVWYWRIKAKDSTAAWSDWSSTWSFILSSTSSSPTPSTTTEPTSAPVPSSSSSSFTISGLPSQINSDQSFTISVNLSLPDNPNTNFYLKGAFKKADGSNYFGLTKVSGNWVKNSSSYTSQYPIKTDSSGNWSGNLEVQPDADDSGYTGTDDYIFKVGKYNSTDVNPSVSWSNEVSIKIIGAATPDSSSNSNPSTTKSLTNPTSSPKITATKTTNTTSSKTSNKIDYRIASVAGVNASSSATPSATAEVKSEKRNFIPWIGGVLILAGISSLLYIYLQNHETVFNKFRKRN